MLNLSTTSSSVGQILDIYLHLDNFKASLNLEVLGWLKLLQVLNFESLGLTYLLVEKVGVSQGGAKTQTQQGDGNMVRGSGHQTVEKVANLGNKRMFNLSSLSLYENKK